MNEILKVTAEKRELVAGVLLTFIRESGEVVTEKGPLEFPSKKRKLLTENSLSYWYVEVLSLDHIRVLNRAPWQAW